MVEIREAKLEDSEQIARLYGDVWEGKYPYSEFINPSKIKKLLEENKCIWMLALDKGEIVGSGACVHSEWNNSTEFGRGVIKKDYRNKHIGLVASEKLIDLAFEREFDICWGTPRNAPVYYVVTRLGFNTVGYMPGPYIVDFREIYLFSMKLSEECKRKRVTPINESHIYDNPLVNLINQAFSLKNNPGEYPEASFVGDEGLATNTFKVKYLDPHQSLFIQSSDLNPEKMCYIEGDILTDKTETITFLESLGFKIAAYMPAWYGKEQRFDCVKMVKQLEDCDSYDKLIKDIRNSIDYEFNERRYLE